MNQKLIAYTFNLADPVEGNSLGALEGYFILPFGATLVYASGTPSADDAGCTFDLMDDGDAAGPTALACAVAATPGEWISTHAGGTETPVAIAAGSVMSMDVNNAAAGVTFAVVLLFLVGESWG
jgi:hypothetical protein